MYLMYSILIICILIVISSLNKFEKFRNKKKELFSLIITLSATFIGVFFAITVSNYSELQKERQNVIRIFDATSIDLDNYINKAKTTYAISSIGNDTLLSIKENLKNNPIRLPRMFYSFVDNNLILKHISNEGLQHYTFCIDGLVTIKSTLYSGNNDDLKNKLEILKVYIRHLEFAKRIISIERANLNNEISNSQLNEYYKEYKFELLGFDPEIIRQKMIQEMR